jgi:molybdopterin-guanine dinucleotide biosynthesis protein A
MLLLGSANRNIGKTALACRLIQDLARTRQVVGIKVTVIREIGRGCPRGEDSCGVCTELGEPYRITREDGAAPGKDTSRMLAAGAGKVLWLRVRSSALAEGRDALLRLLEPGCAVVCESNSFRLAVEPDLFVFVKAAGSALIKPSARLVLPLADVLVHSRGGDFDVPLEHFGFSQPGWHFRRQATAIVLAGGESTRMGCNKALLDVGGRPLIERILGQLGPSFSQILISARNAQDYPSLGYPVIPDRSAGQGPLMGIASALEASENDLNLVVPCDLPDIPRWLVRRLLREARDADAVVPVTSDHHYEPLFAVYRKRVLPAIWKALQRGERRVASLYDQCSLKVLPLPEGVSLKNLNCPADYRALA